MILVKYSRLGRAAYLPHLDVLRLFGRIVRRAKLKVKYSEGFNPHMELFFGNPMSLGIESAAEYVAVASEENAAEFLRRFNEKTVEGFRILLAENSVAGANFADILCAAEYEAQVSKIGGYRSEIESLAKSETFTVEYSNGKKKTAFDKIIDLEIGEESLRVRLKAGRDNLKADEWLSAVLREIGLPEAYRLTKLRQFFDRNGDLADADELFTSPQKTLV